MPTTLPRWNRRPSLGCDRTSQIAVMRISVDPLAYYETRAADGRFRVIHSPNFAAVLIFSIVGLVVSICLSPLLALSQDAASLLAQFGQ